MITVEDMKNGVRYARYTVEKVLNGHTLESVIEELKNKLPKDEIGAFTTIKTYPQKALRGCIGVPEPIYPMYKVVPYTAYSSAFGDPRFPPLAKEELDHVVFEVSYLTKPRLLEVTDPSEYLEKIKIGKHGIIVERGFFKGLFLPQVAIEQNWGPEEFLTECCLKAGLSPDSWLLKDTKIYVFEAKVFEETSPKGEIIEKRLIH